MKTILLILLAASACFAQTPTPEQKTVTVTVYRAKQFVGGMRSLKVFCDGRYIASFKNGRYLVLNLPAGKHVFSGEDSGVSLSLDIIPGEEYFVRAELAVGTFKGTQQVASVASNVAHSEMMNLSRVESKLIWNKDWVRP